MVVQVQHYYRCQKTVLQISMRNLTGKNLTKMIFPG